uniref:Carboxypeptidase n=1 Tax=Steinernema glaseri TaxID=37863 RepID=A0A1I8AU45_9BILA
MSCRGMSCRGMSCPGPISDPYNTYQSCYGEAKNNGSGSRADEAFLPSRVSIATPAVPSWFSYFMDQGALMNLESTDSQGSFQCYADKAIEKYLQLDIVRKALNIPDEVSPWTECNNHVFENYDQETPDMTDVFEALMETGYPLRMLIYNGDVSITNNFMGDQWFIEDLAEKHGFNVTQDFTSWNFSLGADLVPFTGGFSKLFSYGKMTIDLVTVKGAGQFVPTDRPAQALQIFTNFLHQTNYSTMTPYDSQLQPLKEEYEPETMTISRRKADQIFELPGLTFNISFNQYSGYLEASKGNFIHYWLLETQNNPLTDPLILWLGGAPGCSSLGALLTEHGPFHPNPDGKTLFENVYSWNKAASILYLDGPPDVGFSYSDNTNYTYNDQRLAEDTYLALKDFVTVYPEYLNRPLYIAGEGYGGVYAPVLASLLIDKMQSGELTGINLSGMLIGNGELSRIQQIKSSISILYYHGVYGKEEWDQLRQCCPEMKSYQDLALCDFSEDISIDEHGVASAINKSTCGELVVEMGQNGVWKNAKIQDLHNMYEDCYQLQTVLLPSRNIQRNNPNFNPVSTDNQGGFQCYASSATASWLNSPAVQMALHIPIYVQDWDACNEDVANAFVQDHPDTGAVFDHIAASGYPLRVLIYNGDVDPVSNFLGNQWFIEQFAKRNVFSTSKKYGPWNYKQQIGGYWKRFSGDSMELDLLTVKGAGHFAATDRPGPAFQMFNDFLAHRDYGVSIEALSTDKHSLKQEYQIMEWIASSKLGISEVIREHLAENGYTFEATKANVTSTNSNGKDQSSYPSDKTSDKITNLPGLTFSPGFDQYSGFLDASNGTHLHYWLVESQTNPTKDPIILWLNGGPGCSSLNGLLTELGLFRPSADGQLLLENPYAWNKFANVLFLEAPRAVGFSYNEYDPNNKIVYTDDMTANDNLLAVKSFFAKFPEYQKRRFYIMGESFGGVYVPTLVRNLLKDIKNGNSANIDFAGFAIGNGILSQYDQLNSAVDLFYFRGVYSEEQYQAVSNCCTLDHNMDPMYSARSCNFSRFLFGVNPDTATPEELKCSNLVKTLSYDLLWYTANDAYNTYQDCYVDDLTENKRHKREAYSYGGQTLSDKYPFVNQKRQINYKSTDPFRGAPCYLGKGTHTYLNRPDVREALHVDRPELQNVEWEKCSQTLNYNHMNKYMDMSSTFEEIFQSGIPLDILIYNGDVDMVCQFLGDEWFIDRLMGTHDAKGTERIPWTYSLKSENTSSPYLPRLAGYQKRFNLTQFGVTLDQLTVKGSGHMVPLDRPGPALQMITNFITSRDYSAMLPEIYPKPLFKEFVPPTPPPVDRRTADEVFDLPGLTFVPNFRQFSGYLKPKTPGVYLHYWFVKSQNHPATDPIICYFEGGPGGSSLTPMFTEVGPFFPNADGSTFFENVFSWNKVSTK